MVRISPEAIVTTVLGVAAAGATYYATHDATPFGQSVPSIFQKGAEAPYVPYPVPVGIQPLDLVINKPSIIHRSPLAENGLVFAENQPIDEDVTWVKRVAEGHYFSAWLIGAKANGYDLWAAKDNGSMPLKVLQNKGLIARFGPGMGELDPEFWLRWGEEIRAPYIFFAEKDKKLMNGWAAYGFTGDWDFNPGVVVAAIGEPDENGDFQYYMNYKDPNYDIRKSSISYFKITPSGSGVNVVHDDSKLNN